MILGIFGKRVGRVLLIVIGLLLIVFNLLGWLATTGETLPHKRCGLVTATQHRKRLDDEFRSKPLKMMRGVFDLQGRRKPEWNRNLESARLAGTEIEKSVQQAEQNRTEAEKAGYSGGLTTGAVEQMKTA